MKFINKVFLIFSLLLLLEINVVYSKITRYSHTAYRKSKKAHIPSDCGEAIVNGLINFIVGTVHGFIGFTEKLSLDKCTEFVEVMGKIGKLLDIKTEGIDMKMYKLDTVDYEYLKTLNLSEEKRSKLTITALNMFEEKKESKETNATNYKCFKSIHNDFLEKINIVTKVITSLRVPPTAVKAIKFTHKLGKSIYCILCSIRKIVYLISAMIFSPTSINKKTIMAVYDEIKKLYNSGKFTLSKSYLAFLKLFHKFTKKTGLDEFVNKVADKIGDIVRQISEFIKKEINKVENFLEKIWDFIKKSFLKIVAIFSDKIKAIIKKSGIVDNFWKAYENLKKLLGLNGDKKPTFLEKLGIIWENLVKIGTCISTLGESAVVAIQRSYAIVKNIMTLVNSITSLLAGSQGTAIPIVILIFIEISFAIACDGESFEKMYLAFKYAITNQNIYSAGAGIGIALNAIGNPQSLALKVLGFLNAPEFDLSDIDNIGSQLIDYATNNTESKINLIANIVDKVSSKRRESIDEEELTCISDDVKVDQAKSNDEDIVASIENDKVDSDENNNSSLNNIESGKKFKRSHRFRN